MDKYTNINFAPRWHCLLFGHKDTFKVDMTIDLGFKCKLFVCSRCGTLFVRELNKRGEAR